MKALVDDTSIWPSQMLRRNYGLIRQHGGYAQVRRQNHLWTKTEQWNNLVL